MKKIVLALFSLLFFLGCEKTFDTVVDPPTVKYQVINISSFQRVDFNIEDSTRVFFVTINNPTVVGSITVEIMDPDGNKLENSPFRLYNDGDPAHGDAAAGDNTFSHRVAFNRTMINGQYEANYFMTDINSNKAKVAVHSFIFDNGASNLPPSLSSPVIPDSVVRAESFIFHVTASDPNGLNDISSVYFELYRPDGTIVQSSPGVTRFQMHDDGNFEVFGDAVAGDGIYSFKNSFGESSQTGGWRFEFRARDRRGEVSDVIIHTIIVL